MEFLIGFLIISCILYFDLEGISNGLNKIYKDYKDKHCIHEYDKEVNNDGYQFCTKCKRARLVGISECAYNWGNLGKIRSC